MNTEFTNRAKKSQRLANDKTLPLWQRLHQSLQAYAGTKLNLLSVKQRAQLESAFVSINAILSKYGITRFEDYQKMSVQDLSQALNLISNLSASVLPQDQGGGVS